MRATTWLLVPALAFVCIYIGPWALKQAEASALTDQQIEELHNFYNEFSENGTLFSYDQLVQWFENQTDQSVIFEKYPRLFAFCVTSNQIKNSTRTRDDSKIKKFERIIEFLESSAERFYAYNKTKHLIDPTVNPNSWIFNVTVTRINTPEMDMVNLKQWVHLKVNTTSNVTIQGLYIQAVVGPLGLPFGEFSNEFPCVDGPDTKDIETVGELVPCTYRPRCTITHPSVYVGYDPNGRDEFHTNYFWTDITCMETPYVQFIIIAVKDFDEEPKTGVTHQALLSSVFLNSDFDSKSGAPYPYYPEWKDRMYCYQDETSMDTLYKQLYTYNNNPNNVYPSAKVGADAKFKEINWRVSTDIFRIQPNEKYDSCLTSDVKVAFEGRDSLRLECPPGPFRCNSSYGNSSKDVTMQRLELIENEKNVSNCIPCGAPECELSGFSEDDCHNRVKLAPVSVTNLSSHVETTEQITKGKAHGIAAMLAFLVLVPLSNFVARFYKEVCGQCLCGNGPWIFFHVASQVISVMVMWLSIGPVTPKLLDYGDAVAQCYGAYPPKPNENDSPQARACVQQVSFANPHVPLAVFAFFMQHLLVAFGFLRMANNKIRHIQVILHSHFGHACWILGGIAGLVAAFGDQHGCLDPQLFTSLLIFVPLVFYAAGVSIDCINDKKIGIIPPRKQWPVLEAVKLEGNGPCTMPKCIVFSVFALFMMLIWVVALGSNLSVISGNFDLKNGTQGNDSVFKVGLFGCEIETGSGPVLVAEDK